MGEGSEVRWKRREFDTFIVEGEVDVALKWRRVSEFF